MTIIEKIDKLRIERGWSVNNLAMEAMLTQSTLNNLYMRNTEPKISTLRAICNAFGITLAEFFMDEEFTKEQENNEKELSDRFSKLTDTQKKAFMSMLRSIT